LLSAIPTVHPEKRRRRFVLQGDVPSPINPPSGCRFHPRCPLAMDVCRRDVPRELNVAGHIVRCHAVEQELNANPQVDAGQVSQRIAAAMSQRQSALDAILPA
jgi:oligopeptide/dipeptide ABC transporter ATP-binding protein